MRYNIARELRECPYLNVGGWQYRFGCDCDRGCAWNAVAVWACAWQSLLHWWVQVQDDCIAVKDVGGGASNARCAENWLVERVNASGVGLTIGSVQNTEEGTCVRNITFRCVHLRFMVNVIVLRIFINRRSKVSWPFLVRTG